MRAVCQRVARASVVVAGEEVSSIGPGLLLLVGVAVGDAESEALALAGKVAGLRVFADEGGRMNLSVRDVSGEVMVVSQFTLLSDARKGRRPSYTAAAPPEIASPLIATLARALRDGGIPVAEGVFGARMAIELLNDGPVTLVLDVADGKIV